MEVLGEEDGEAGGWEVSRNPCLVERKRGMSS